MVRASEVASRTHGGDACPVPADLEALVLAEREPVGPLARLVAVGDVGLSGRVARAGAAFGYESLLAEVAPVLRTGDMGFANIEFPLSGGSGETGLFLGDSAGAPALRAAGITLGQVANSHSVDFGPGGLERSADALRLAGIVPLGIGSDEDEARVPVRTDVGGLRIAWIAGARTHFRQEEPGPKYWNLDETVLMQGIREARQDVDILIVSLHMGLAYLDHPDPRFKAMVERAFDAGADLVLLHHAHVLQSVQAGSGGRLCCHSLGNFLLDWREGHVEVDVMAREQQEAAVFLFDLDAGGVARAVALPTFIDRDFRVRWATGKQGARILGRLERISREIRTDYAGAFTRQRITRNVLPTIRVLAHHAIRGDRAKVRETLEQVRWEHVVQVARWVRGRVAARLGRR
jgi:poly-gamma-glutamate synthesis protein (capsule biosynthesis protein)